MTSKIPLTQGKFALVDDEDYLSLVRFYWHAVKVIRKDRVMFYARRMTLISEGKPRRGLFMHRIILGIENTNLETDHKDNDGLNNQRTNLREATRQQNSCNQPKLSGCSSKFKGVTREYEGGAWISQIQNNGVHQVLGRFYVEERAAQEYDKAAIKLFGEFANTNFKRSE